jgi:hypothetical protein
MLGVANYLTGVIVQSFEWSGRDLNSVFPLYYQTRLNEYTIKCKELIKNYRTYGARTLYRMENSSRIKLDGTMRRPNEAIWFVDKHAYYVLEEYADDRASTNPNFDKIELTCKLGSDVYFLDLTGKNERYYIDPVDKKFNKSFYNMNQELITSIFDYLFYKLEIYNKTNTEKQDFEEQINGYGYKDGERFSQYQNDRKIIEIILNDSLISSMVQGYYHGDVVWLNHDEPFHSEYCFLQRDISRIDENYSCNIGYNTNCDKPPEPPEQVNYSRSKYPPKKANKVNNPSLTKSKPPLKKGGGTKEEEDFLKQFILVPGKDGNNDIDIFLQKYQTLVVNMIDDQTEIKNVMMYIIDPYICKIIWNDYIAKIAILKQRTAYQTVFQTTIFRNPVSISAGKSKRVRKGQKNRRTRTKKH